jgi:hemolysin type calcium-binding protein
VVDDDIVAARLLLHAGDETFFSVSGLARAQTTLSGGRTAATKICGLPGDDVIRTRGGDDFVDSGTGSDTVSAGADVVTTREGDDHIDAKDGEPDSVPAAGAATRSSLTRSITSLPTARGLSDGKLQRPQPPHMPV